ncbi:MAG TPA: malto-oligosyltrehalose trehalohydrolase [Stellaceae bacterium]|nr:malto-oligosyltrehalose trehalohydrolase [Stellaceae bacterium]
MNHFAHAMPFGATVLPEGGAWFRLWAPAQERVRLVLGEAGATRPMEQREGGWFEHVVADAPPGTPYRFELADGLRVPDPASRAQAADVHGASLVVEPQSYTWKYPEWQGRHWRETVLYEAHLGCFTPEGTFDGARRKLDHLVALGVTALELMPIAAFEGERGWGYDGVLLFAPHRAYGAPDDLKRLIDEAHERNLMVFLDVVYNHFGPSGNYLHLYAPQFFTERHRTPWGAAINFDGARSDVARQFFIHNALYWLEEYRFDGLRLDAVHAIADDGKPDILTELAATVRARCGPSRHVHLVLENDGNESRRLRRDSCGTSYDAQWNDDMHHATHVALTGEAQGYYVDYVDDPVGRLARALAEGFAYQGERSRHRKDVPRGEPCADLPTVAFVDFLQNHDQVGNRAFGERLASLAPREALDAVTLLLFLSPHIPMLFMGEEWGSRTPFYFFSDFHGDLAVAVRDGRRREFAKFPDFQDPTTRERIPDPNARGTFEASRLDWRECDSDTARRRLERVVSLLALRQREIVPRIGASTGKTARYEVREGRALRVTWRLDDGAHLSVITNLSQRPLSRVTWPIAGRVIATEPTGLAVDARLEQLPPWSVIWTLAPPNHRP